MSFIDKIAKLESDFLQELQEIATLQEVEQIKLKYLGRKGLLQGLIVQFKSATKEEKPELGKALNLVKQKISTLCEEHLSKLQNIALQKRLQEEKIDITLPGRRKFRGKKHPVQIILDKSIEIFIEMGFSVQYGPNIDSDFYNFEGLNFPLDHPARDMQDTFWLSDDTLLRTHTSNVQVRVMEKNNPPIRVIAPGRCFRNETISSRSHIFFHQIEGFYIEKGVSFGDLVATMEEFWSKLFQRKAESRFRPSYFPFVEPGMEVDIRCTCKGGCKICKHTGWLEVCGAGMIHPEVLQAGGIDPEVYTGYAWGLGIERIALLLYDIPDIRMFTENDSRFLTQFS